MSDLTIEFMGHDVKLIDVEYTAGCEAQISGPPEHCYPSEPNELYYTVNTGNELLDILLTENFSEEIKELAYQGVADEAEAAEETYYESKAEDMKMEAMGL